MSLARPLEPIVAHDVRLESTASGLILSCRLRAPGSDLPSTLWYKVPLDLSEFVSPNGDPFLPPLVLAGMSLGRPVVIEADVSATLLHSIQRIQQVEHRWGQRLGDRLAIVTVSAPPHIRTRRGSMCGAFFSLGVDSFYTVLRNLRRYPAGDPRLITHLVLVHGFDIVLEKPSLFATVRQHALDVAAALGKRLIPVETNVRAVVKSLDWGQYGCGPAMGGVGLALAGLLHTVLIGASDTYEKLSPWGSHPAVDLLWSTETLEFVYDGAELERFDKIGLLASSPVAMEGLRVCWENRDGAYNCGQCEKCLRTMVALHCWGAFATAARFPKPLNPATVARLSLESPVRPWWTEMLQELKKTGADPALISAIERAVHRGVWSESRLGKADRPLGLLLARVGLTPERVKRFDTRWLHGMGAAGIRWLQRRHLGDGRS